MVIRQSREGRRVSSPGAPGGGNELGYGSIDKTAGSKLSRSPAGEESYLPFCCFLISRTIRTAVRSNKSGVDPIRPSYPDQTTSRDFKSTRKMVPVPRPNADGCGCGLLLSSFSSVSAASGGG